MTAWSISSRIRTASEDFDLVLKIHHSLVSQVSRGALSDIQVGNSKIPDDVDVLPASIIVLTMEGIFNHLKVSDEAVLKSALSGQLCRFLQMNIGQLGLDAISNLYMDDDGRTALSLTPSNFLHREQLIPHLTLISIDLQYVWTTPTNRDTSGKFSCDIDHNPFTPQLLLPFESALQNVMHKFVSIELVKRYPLIFGTWRKKLDLEAPFYRLIGPSVFNVIQRSSDTSFRPKCRRLLTTMKRQYSLAYDAARSALTDCQRNVQVPPEALGHEPNDERAFALTMERLYRTGTKRPNFKVCELAKSPDSDADDEHPFELQEDIKTRVSEMLTLCPNPTGLQRAGSEYVKAWSPYDHDEGLFGRAGEDSDGTLIISPWTSAKTRADDRHITSIGGVVPAYTSAEDLDWTMDESSHTEIYMFQDPALTFDLMTHQTGLQDPESDFLMTPVDEQGNDRYQPDSGFDWLLHPRVHASSPDSDCELVDEQVPATDEIIIGDWDPEDDL